MACRGGAVQCLATAVVRFLLPPLWADMCSMVMLNVDAMDSAVKTVMQSESTHATGRGVVSTIMWMGTWLIRACFEAGAV